MCKKTALLSGTIHPQYFLGGAAYAFVIDIPFAHLTQVEELVVFVLRPTHMEDVRMDLALKDILHELRPLVEGMSTREVVCIARKNFWLQSVSGCKLR